MPENEEPKLLSDELQRLVDEEEALEKAAERRRHPSKSDRWGIEDKVVDSETK